MIFCLGLNINILFLSFGIAAVRESQPEWVGITTNTQLPELLCGTTQNKRCCCDDYWRKCSFSLKSNTKYVQWSPPRVFFSLNVKVFDQSALSLEAKEEMYKLFPNARRAHLKTGGNFPYLCRSAEVNLYVQVGLKLVNGTYNKVPAFFNPLFVLIQDKN